MSPTVRSGVGLSGGLGGEWAGVIKSRAGDWIQQD